MSRKSYVQIDGKLYDKAELSASETPQSVVVRGDLPDFISPIDGSLVSGRAGLRDHCKRHNVVPTADLKGLPPKPMVMPVSNEQRQQTRQVIADVINSRNYR